MTFPRLRPSWSLGDVLAAAEMDTLDQNVSRSVDGYGGGSYAPSSQLVFGGAGLRVTGPFRADDAEMTVPAGKYLDVAGQFDMSGAASFTGPSKFDATVDVNAYWNFNGVGPTGGVRFYGAADFKPDSATFVEGAAGQPAVWAFGRNTTVTVNGVSGHVSAWTIGTYSTFADAGTWTHTAGHTWSGASAGITVTGAGSAVSIESGAVMQTGATTTATFDGAVVINKDILLAGTPSVNNLYAPTIVKVQANVHLNYNGPAPAVNTMAIDDGVGCSLGFSGNPARWRLDFATPFANNDYSVEVTACETVGWYMCKPVAKTTGHVDFEIWNVSGGVAVGAWQVAAEIGHDVSFDVTIVGRQA